MNNNLDKQKLINAVLASSGGKINRETLTNAVGSGDVSSIMNNMSPEDKQKLSSILASKGGIAAALASDEAKAIIKSLLKGGGNNG